MKTKEFMTALSTEDAQNINGGYQEPPVIGPTKSLTISIP